MDRLALERVRLARLQCMDEVITAISELHFRKQTCSYETCRYDTKKRLVVGRGLGILKGFWFWEKAVRVMELECRSEKVHDWLSVHFFLPSEEKATRIVNDIELRLMSQLESCFDGLVIRLQIPSKKELRPFAHCTFSRPDSKLQLIAAE